MNNATDDRITLNATNKLNSRGFSAPCRLTVQTKNGQVTLSGTVQYAHQIGAAACAINGMASVRRVINQISVKPANRR